MKKLITILSILVSTMIVAPFVPEVPVLLVAAGLVVAAGLMPDAKTGIAFMAIPIQDARSLFTKTLVAVYKEQISPMSYLRSFFRPVESMSKEISIEVRRGKEKVAVNVQRHSDGNYNKFSLSTEKIFIPPFFYEWMAANDHRLYDVAIGSGGSAPALAQLAAELSSDLVELKNKIERAYEKMCADIFENGRITLVDGTVIDFKRKSASIVDKGAGAYWATGTVDPFVDLENGCKFLRKTGKSRGNTVNAIFGEDVLSDFLNNTIVKARHDIWNYKLGTMDIPEMQMEGVVFHGEVSCGAYRVRVFTYPEYYEAADGTMTPYINPKKVVMLPTQTDFIMSFAAVPQLIGPGGEIPQKGAYLVTESIDQKKTVHEIGIKSAGLPIPVAVDRIYTVQVKA